MKKYVFIINGYPQSGKDTFVKYCKEIIGKKVYLKSSIDNEKTIATICGWNGIKNDESRKMLSDLKKYMKALFKKYSIMYFVELDEFVETMKNDDILFYMVREPEEIADIVNYYKHSNTIVKSIFIDKSNNIECSNDSDKNVKNYRYDLIIPNNESIDKLYNKAIIFSKSISTWR